MNPHDPITNYIGIVVHRLVLFVILSFILATALWLWVLLGEFHVTASDLLHWLREAWTPVDNKLAAVILYGALTVGVLSTSVLYLLIGKWWNKRADVRQYRGARFEEGGM
jgi:hypothetical protein